MLYAAGVPNEETMRTYPHVGIASVWWEGNPCKYVGGPFECTRKADGDPACIVSASDQTRLDKLFFRSLSSERASSLVSLPAPDPSSARSCKDNQRLGPETKNAGLAVQHHWGEPHASDPLLFLSQTNAPLQVSDAITMGSEGWF